MLPISYIITIFAADLRSKSLFPRHIGYELAFAISSKSKNLGNFNPHLTINKLRALFLNVVLLKDVIYWLNSTVTSIGGGGTYDAR